MTGIDGKIGSSCFAFAKRLNGKDFEDYIGKEHASLRMCVGRHG